MKNLFTFVAVSAAACTLSMAAHASTIVDFAAYAAGNEGGVASGTSLNINGVNLTFESNFNPYFDDVSGGKPAGLGVCRELNAKSQCVDAGDDSADGDFGVNEYIAVIFDDGPFNVFQLSFRDGRHNLLNFNDIGLVKWGIFDAIGDLLNTGVTTFADILSMAAAGDFAHVDGIGFQFVDTEFYVENISDVPVPAALPLLFSGLAGLAFATRRKKGL